MEDKFEAIVAEVKTLKDINVPVLVGTASGGNPPKKCRRGLKAAGIKHEVLNAKQHEREADIIAQAGRPGG